MPRATERTYKTGDVGVTFGATLSTDEVGGIDLTDATVRFVMTHRDGDKVIEGAATVDIATDHVLYTFESGDLDTAGVFLAEWEVTFAGGVLVHFPDDAFHRIEVLADLD